MNLGYRMGSKKDTDVIFSFLEKKTSFPQYMGFENKDIIVKKIKDVYHRHNVLGRSETFPLIIAEDIDTGDPVGYMLLQMGIAELFTGKYLARIFDYHIDIPGLKRQVMDHFINQAEMFAEENQLSRLIVEIPAGEKEEEDYFLDRGFYIEINKIIKKAKNQNLNTRLQRRYTVRPMENRDRMFVLLLVAQNSKFLIPPELEEESKRIEEECFNSYSDMNLLSDPEISVYIIEETETFRQVGYIIMQTKSDDVICARKNAYVYDISIHHDFWGKYAAQRLLREAENIFSEKGYYYLYADTSQNNPRALKMAVKSLGYKLYSRRWAKKVEI
ncbi:MAG: GNAT family N-acetyltransferase [Candidatus Eremiobacteraeota bacterium]|nr:GNAT family N-acetyltransferase [Candidatus Eremiobacteraeota bacterium]